MPGEVIAVANHKGGVGKSFTAVNLAAGLAQGSWSTLIVDIDPQANSTEMFGTEEPDHDLFEVLARDLPVEKAIIGTGRPNLDLLPSRLWGAQLDKELMGQYHREAQLRKSLSPVLERYDAIVMDLPPTLGQLVITSLAAADSLIVPTDASRWGRRGLAMFLEWSTDLRKAEVLTADLLGVLLTKYEPNTRISRDVRQELIDTDQPLFETLIPKRTAAERMVGERQVLGDPGADDDLTEAYGHFTIEVMNRIRQRREERGGRHRG